MDIHVEAGDYVDIDELVEQFKAKGYEAKYENLQSGYGYFAKMIVTDGDESVTIFVDSDGHEAMVKEIS